MTFCVSAELIMDWVVVGAEVLSAIAAIVGLAIAGNWFSKARQQQRVLGKNLKNYGIERINTQRGALDKKDRALLFGLRGKPVPKEVCLSFISGCHFIDDYQEEIKNLAARGCVVKLLLAKPNGFSAKRCDENGKFSGENLQLVTDHYFKIIKKEKPSSTFQDREFIMLVLSHLVKADDEQTRKNIQSELAEHGDHASEVVWARGLLRKLRKSRANGGDIILRYYVDEYQMPIIMAKYDVKKKKDVRLRLWTNMNAPIKETMQSVSVYAVDIEDNEKCFASDVEKSFDYLWETYSKPNGGNELF